MRILICDSLPLFADVISKVCVECGHTVVGVTDTVSGVVSRFLAQSVDLVILDSYLSDGDGFEVLSQLKINGRTAKILVCSAHDDPYMMYRITRLLFVGFVAKDAKLILSLPHALSRIREGGYYFTTEFEAMRNTKVKAVQNVHKYLSNWEVVVLSLVGAGLSDEEISERLGMCMRTAGGHRSAILRKLRIPSTPRLMAFALENGFARIVCGRIIPSCVLGT